jgi:hypothetical protein
MKSERKKIKHLLPPIFLIGAMFFNLAAYPVPEKYDNINNQPPIIQKVKKEEIEEINKIINEYECNGIECGNTGIGTYLTENNIKIDDSTKRFLDYNTGRYYQTVFDDNGNIIKFQQEIQCVGYVAILSDLYGLPSITGLSFVFPGEIIPKEIKNNEKTISNIGRYIIINPKYEEIPEKGLFLGKKHVGAFFTQKKSVLVAEANCNRNYSTKYKCVGDGEARLYELTKEEFIDFLIKNNYFILY